MTRKNNRKYAALGVFKVIDPKVHTKPVIEAHPNAHRHIIHCGKLHKYRVFRIYIVERNKHLNLNEVEKRPTPIVGVPSIKTRTMISTLTFTNHKIY